jgi:hypothetical protein
MVPVPGLHTLCLQPTGGCQTRTSLPSLQKSHMPATTGESCEHHQYPQLMFVVEPSCNSDHFPVQDLGCCRLARRAFAPRGFPCCSAPTESSLHLCCLMMFGIAGALLGRLLCAASACICRCALPLLATPYWLAPALCSHPCPVTQ